MGQVSKAEWEAEGEGQTRDSHTECSSGHFRPSLNKISQLFGGIADASPKALESFF